MVCSGLVKTQFFLLLTGLALVASRAAPQVTTPRESVSPGQIVPQQGIPTIRVTTRIVIERVLALDDEDRPVRDLTADDFRVFEKTGKSGKLPQKISGFRALEGSAGSEREAEVLDVPMHHSYCSLGSIPFHYELSYYPAAESGTSGVHRISITCNRRNIRLFYRDGYVMPRGDSTAVARAQSDAVEQKRDQDLFQAACVRLPHTPIVVKEAYPLRNSRLDQFRYFLAIDAKQLTFVREEKGAYSLGMDYAACAQDTSQKRLYYAQGGAKQLLTEHEYQTAKSNGFPLYLEMARTAGTAYLNVVVRDRETGQMRAVVIAYAPTAEAGSNDSLTAPREPIGSFGTTEPLPLSLCGDVYELIADTRSLPFFSQLDAMAVLYTTRLDVPDHHFTEGIPHVTERTAWIGINYQGTIWVSEPGEYRFRLNSDDGAKLYIDDELIIANDGIHWALEVEGKVQLSAGEHRIHVPYFQGTPTNVALVLEVQRPGMHKWEIFDMRQFVRPAEK